MRGEREEWKVGVTPTGGETTKKGEKPLPFRSYRGKGGKGNKKEEGGKRDRRLESSELR